MEHELIRAPKVAPPKSTRYRLTPRPKASFNTVLDAHAIVAPGSVVEVTCEGELSDGALEITMRIPLKGGRIQDTLTVAQRGAGLVASTMRREVFGADDVRKRSEEVDFDAQGVLPLPPNTYPEVMLPFLLRWQPFDGQRRGLHAWINDRFVARVYYETVGETRLKLASGESRRAVECIMYPDLNDWVPLGKIINKLAKPLVPKYHMWFSPDAEHVLRFEGPYGPPGAPEIVLEWVEAT